MADLKSSEDWHKEPKYNKIVIMDPDGWNRKDYKNSWAEEISRDEFEQRVGLSTCSYPAGFFEQYKSA